MVSGNIPIIETPAYCSYSDWVNKYGISTADESETQFATDLKEAHILVRRKCMYLVREKVIYKRSDGKCFLPLKWMCDANMDGVIDTSDIVIHQLSSDGLTYDTVDRATYITSVDAFNNHVQLNTDTMSALSRQLYITYYCCSKPFDEVKDEEFKRAVMAQVTILVIERLRRQWGLKGSTGWSAGGITVNKDINAYKVMYDEAQEDLNKFAHFLQPTVMRPVKTGLGRGQFYDDKIAWSDQFLGRSRVNMHPRFF